MVKSEKRKYSRKEAHLFTVFIRSGSGEELPLPQIGYTRDISAGGAYFFTQSEVDEGDHVSVTVHLTADWAEGGNPPRLEGEGTILRVEKARKAFPSIDVTGAAVQFARELAVAL